jgi:acyl carrier protein
MNREKVNQLIRDFILTHFLQMEDDVELDSSMALITGGIMDSISTLQLVDYIETTFEIDFEPHEVDSDNLNSIELITNFVLRKM